MTTSPPDESGTSDPTAPQPAPPPESVSLAKPAAEDVPFDPYRYGAPEHPVPPEYAPPGYQPPPPIADPYAGGPQQPPGYPPMQHPYAGAPGPYPGPYAGPQYGYPPPPYAGQYPQPKTGNGKATAGLVLGIVSIVFFWTSFFDAIPVVLGLIFGFLGLSESKRTNSGRSSAIAGIICAAIGAALAIILTVVIISRLQPCFNNYNSGSAEFNSCVRHHI